MPEAGDGASGRKQIRMGHVLGGWAWETHVYLKPRLASVASIRRRAPSSVNLKI